MAATWAVTLLLVGYFSVCDGVVCSVSRRSLNGSSSIYYKGYMSCSNLCCGPVSQRYCCSSSRTGYYVLIGFGAILSVSLLLVLLVYCAKKKKRPSPRQPLVASSGISRGIEPGYGEKPVTHYPMPPSIKANDLTNGSSGPVHPPGQNSYSGQINTRTLPPGTIHPPPSVPPSAWQAPPPGAPQSDNPPMPQPDPPETSKLYPPTTSPSDDNPLVTAPGASGIHQPPAVTPLPPSDKAPTTAAPTQGEEEGESY